MPTPHVPTTSQQGKRAAVFIAFLGGSVLSRSNSFSFRLRAPDAARGRQARRVVRIGLEHLESRETPALFTVGSPQTSNQLHNNGFVATGDWNGDGKLDIVMTNYGEGDFST